LRAFVGVLAQPEHPLVLFLDDIQWADTPSLDLLWTLLASAQSGCLFVIAAYRDNEVDAAHPALLMADEVRKAGTVTSSILLGPLSVEDTVALVADTLRAPERAADLAHLLHARTGGNPFFLIQLLHSLHDDGLVARDATGAWTWDLGRIAKEGLTD